LDADLQADAPTRAGVVEGTAEFRRRNDFLLLPNPDGRWRPGLYVTAEVEVATVDVPVAVSASAVQRLRDRDVVFVSEGDLVEAQPVELGRRDADRVELRAGLAAGQRYVAEGSFLLKAEVGKAGASHEH
jgi:cobalt-zinc-cadmium efflux system membrane fusion protein